MVLVCLVQDSEIRRRARRVLPLLQHPAQEPSSDPYEDYECRHQRGDDEVPGLHFGRVQSATVSGDYRGTGMAPGDQPSLHGIDGQPLQLDQSGSGPFEAARFEVEPLEVGVEVDVEPLATCITRHHLPRTPRPDNMNHNLTQKT